MSKVVVTGLGVVTPLGTGVDDFWKRVLAGESGADLIQSFDASEQAVRIACEVRDFDAGLFMDGRAAARCDRFSQMALAAARLSWEHSGLSLENVDRERAGVIVGSAIGGLPTIEAEHRNLLDHGQRRVSPFMVPKLMPNGAAALIAMELSLLGINHGVSSACATGAHAIGSAYACLAADMCDVVLAGGSEAALTPLSLAAFSRMGALSQRNDDPRGASRPFDAERDGFVFGEGAGVLVLEREEHARRRGATVLAELAGYGATADAFHVTQPDPQGDGAARAMRTALKQAGASVDEVDYVNAHGTSTPYNDRIETLAIKKALGDHASKVPISSTKSQIGHLLGAAGAVEAAVTVMALRERVVPATLNLEHPDPDCDLDYVPNEPREMRLQLALSNSFGFGGQNACLAFRTA